MFYRFYIYLLYLYSENEDQISAEEKNKKDIQSVIDRVEGLSNELDSASDRVLIHEGDLLELEPLNHGPLRRVHLFLFNDLLLVATWMPSRYKSSNYTFTCTFINKQADPCLKAI